MAHINMNCKPANKFKMVQLDDVYRFNQLQKENSEIIVPCQLYVDKETGMIYFVEQQQGEILDTIVDSVQSIDYNYINAGVPF